MKINSSKIIKLVLVETDIGIFRVDSDGNVEVDCENQYGAYEFKFVDFEMMNYFEIDESIVKEIRAYGLSILNK